MWLRLKSTLLCRLTYLIVFGVFVAGTVVTCSADDADPTPTFEPTQPPPTSQPANSPASEAGTIGERVEAGESSMLIWSGGEPAVILVHGAIYDAASWTNQAREIADAGMTAIAVESASADGILLAVEHARSELGVTRLVLVGASAGAPPVMSIASEGDADGVIVLAGTGDASQLPDIPALFIAAEGDGGAADRMRQMESDAPGDAEALIVSGDAHAQAIFTTPQGEEVMSEILDWLAQFE